jgi:hypothetical protein
VVEQFSVPVRGAGDREEVAVPGSGVHRRLPHLGSTDPASPIRRYKVR